MNLFKYYWNKFRLPGKLKLNRVTLIGVDCVDPDRLLASMKLCQEFVRFGDVKLLSSLPVKSKHWHKIPPITSTEAYSEFIAKQLTDYITTDFVLIVQYDGFILNPWAWSDDFLQYDYIGAPWWFKEGHNVGNGGFSLRSKRFLDLMANDNKTSVLHPEDSVFCRLNFHHLVNQGIKFAPHHVARRFSMEGRENFHDVWDQSFGFHGFNVTDISRWNHWIYSTPQSEKFWAQVKKEAHDLFMASRKK